MTATESLFFGTINDFCNTICHFRTHALAAKEYRHSVGARDAPSGTLALLVLLHAVRLIRLYRAKHCCSPDVGKRGYAGRCRAGVMHSRK
jgi:hypothetical protein